MSTPANARAGTAAVLVDGLVCRAGRHQAGANGDSGDSAAAGAAGRVLLDLPQLRINQGERVVLVGPNGAGKSTLLRCLSGFTQPNQGRAVVLGHLLDRPASSWSGRLLNQGQLPRAQLRQLRREVGQLLQGLHLVARLSVLDNTLMGALGRLQGAAAWRSLWRQYPAAEVAAAHAALQAVGLATRLHERVDSLSGGERQKVAMARLLLQRPRLVLADEPTASLDPAAAQAACVLLNQVAAGATLLSIVHEPALLPLLGSRVLGLRAGRLVFDRPVAQVDAALLAALYQPQTA